MRPLPILLLTGLLVFGTVQAAPVPLQLVGSAEQASIISTSVIQYTYDPDRRLLTIVEGKLGKTLSPIPQLSIQESGANLTFKLPEGYGLTPSADGLSLNIARLGAINQSSPSLAPASAILSQEPVGVIDPEVYILSYAPPTSVAQLMSELYPNVKVRVDERQHALFVLVNPVDKAAIDRFIQKVDVPTPQVQFEAQVIEINRSLTRSLGIDYDKIFAIKFSEAAPDSIFSLGKLTRGPLSFGLNINLLENSGASKVLAKPRVTALDGVEARVNATQTYPLIVSGGNNVAPIVQNITTGITLSMLPKIAKNGEIEVKISISVSTPTGFTSDGAPQYSSREASTIVRVKEGETIALGGLIENRRLQGISKVPFLGDIPLIGKLFQKSTTDERETDLVILVTPTLLKTATPAAIPTAP